MPKSTEAGDASGHRDVLIMVCLTVNFVMGCGYLGLGWGMARSGIVPGILITFGVAAMAFVSIVYEIESIVRTDALLRLRKRPAWPLIMDTAENRSADASPSLAPVPFLALSAHTPATVKTPLKLILTDDTISPQPSPPHGSPPAGRPPALKFQCPALDTKCNGPMKEATPAARTMMPAIGAPFVWRQNTTICHLLYGTRAAAGYCFLLCLGYLGSLWAFAQVFASSLARHVPLPGLNGGATCDIYTHEFGSACWELYGVYIAIFALISACLLVMDAKDRMPIMFLLLFGRIAVVFVMVGSIYFASHLAGKSALVDSPPTSTVLGPGQSVAITERSRIDGIGLLIPIALFCQPMNGSASAVARTASNPRKIVLAVGIGIGLTGFMYMAVGVSAALFFGKNTHQASNLNWQSYPWGHSLSPDQDLPLATRAIRVFVVLFPAAQVMSTFLLVSGMLGDNLAALYKLYLDKAAPPTPQSPSKWGTPPSTMTFQPSQEEDEDKAEYQLGFRFVAALLPLVGAVCFHNMIGVLDYTGTVSIVISVIIPPMFQRRTIKACQKWRKCNGDTIFRLPCLSSASAAAVMEIGGYGLLLLCIVIIVTL